MAKMSREWFLAAFEDFIQRARTNFARDGYVAPVLLGFDAKGTQLLALGTDPAAVEGPEAQKAIRQGMHILPAPFRDHQESVLAMLTGANCVAAIQIGEAWYAHGAVAQDVVEMGIATHEHPSRDEVVLITAAWPREYLFRVNTMQIHRDANGKGTLGETFTPEGARSSGAFLDAWLSGMLPQPFGAKR